MVFIKEVEADVAERYGLVIERIQNIKIDDTVSAPYRDYFVKVADFMLYLHELLMLVDKDEFRTLPMDELKAHNDRMFEEIRSRNYDTSYTNPEYAVKTLGQEYGQYLCDLLLKIRATHTYAMEHRVLEMTVVYELFVEIYNIFESEELSVQAVKDAVYWHVSDYQDLFLDYQIRSIVDSSLTFYKDIVMDSDLSDLRYLYWYGYNITDNEIEIAKFLNSRTEAEIDDMAATCTEGFVRGFVLGRKDLSKKKTVNIYMPIGFERMVRKVVERLGKSGLNVIIREAGVSSTVANKQYQFDHKFNIGLYMDKAYVDRRLTVAKVAFERYKDMAALMAGPIAIETFGETPFEPVAKKEAIKLDAKQQKLHSSYSVSWSQIYNEYIKGDETSFTIIAYPIPEIGGNFQEIFADTIKINTLDQELYQQIQTDIIGALDQAEYVRVQGKGDNKTDIKVMMQSLNDPSKETLFENCLADVNIPVGEVFTSPKLTGTEGVLNVSEVYLRDLKYTDLCVTFKDGKITDYTCKNFDDEEENKRFIKENLLYNHETLPIGEFAIGTNTTAYVIGKKYDIVYKLPILIVEKMGPHFAVGDTCYSYEEDAKTYNPDGKEIVAKDNECTLLRKTDMEKAYFGCHTDITIPYEEIADISAYTKDGRKITIIEDGRFVLPGTESLNEPFNEN
ncbi:MAG: aminopeptidase [Lachnospiraceae bacterium]|nr:aminopeptidase [Lachnospiraceae bacterium]